MMDVGMLWLDDDPNRRFAEKIQRAADYYAQKYGHIPNTCLVNNRALDKEMKVGGIQVVPAKNVLPHHFWIGCQNQNGQEVKNTDIKVERGDTAVTIGDHSRSTK